MKGDKMRDRWLFVVRDITIVTILFMVGGFIVGYATRGIYTKDSLFVACFLMGILGFFICGCLTIENRWKHLFIVALGVWLINCCYSLAFLPFSVLAWVLNIATILIPMVIGGALSSLLVKTKKQRVKNTENIIKPCEG